MIHSCRHFTLLVVILGSWLIPTVLQAQPAPKKYRGGIVRIDIRRTVEKRGFHCELAKTTSSFICLQFRERIELTHTEVIVYQAMQEVVREKNKDGQDVIMEFAPIPGETLEGDESERVEIKITDPLVNESFRILGKDYVTNNDGLIVDYKQDILAAFDFLTTPPFDLTISHATMGKQVVNLTRTLIIPPFSEKPAKNTASHDILLAFGQNYDQQLQSGRDGLEVSVTMATSASAGDSIAIVVNVSNKGPKAVSNLIARTFSRHAWLDGKFFYFGLVNAGAQAQFTRFVQAPVIPPPHPCFLSIAFKDVLGDIPDKQQCLKLDIQPRQ